MKNKIRLATYNIRKGKGASGRVRHDVQRLGEALAAEKLDLVLCQEVFHGTKSTAAQSLELSEATGLNPYYLPNRRRRIGHHGNATLTRLAVSNCENYDVSTNRIERRGVLYTKLRLQGRPLHVFNVHLSLSHRQRLAQLRRIHTILGGTVAENDAVLLAGDFNDWHRRLEPRIVQDLGFTNACDGLRPRLRTWHARRPLFDLDRVYLRNLEPVGVERLSGDPWRDLSDHLPLAVELRMLR